MELKTYLDAARRLKLPDKALLKRVRVARSESAKLLSSKDIYDQSLRYWWDSQNPALLSRESISPQSLSNEQWDTDPLRARPAMNRAFRSM